jgi:hypothetical protein
MRTCPRLHLILQLQEILDEALKAKVTKGTAGDDSKTKGQEEEPASTSEQAEDDLGVD